MKKKLKKIWVKFSKSYGRTIIHPQYIKRSLEYKAILEAKKYTKGKLVDIGCGRMPYKKLFEPLVKKYIGVDHPKVSKLYKGEIKPDVMADAHNLPFAANTFDIALSLQVLEYLQDPQEFFIEAYRVLRQGGVLVLSCPFLYPLHDIPYDRARYSKTTLEEFIKKAKLKVVSVHYEGNFLEFWFQSLEVFLLRRILDIISGKKNVLAIIYLLLLIVITPFLVVVLNLIILLNRQLSKALPVLPNYFPLEVHVIAKK